MRELSNAAATETGDYDVEIHDDHVRLCCNKCGRHLNIPITSLTAANDFLGCDKLVLKE